MLQDGICLSLTFYIVLVDRSMNTDIIYMQQMLYKSHWVWTERSVCPNALEKGFQVNAVATSNGASITAQICPNWHNDSGVQSYYDKLA